MKNSWLASRTVLRYGTGLQLNAIALENRSGSLRTKQRTSAQSNKRCNVRLLRLINDIKWKWLKARSKQQPHRRPEERNRDAQRQALRWLHNINICAQFELAEWSALGSLQVLCLLKIIEERLKSFRNIYWIQLKNGQSCHTQLRGAFRCRAIRMTLALCLIRHTNTFEIPFTCWELLRASRCKAQANSVHCAIGWMCCRPRQLKQKKHQPNCTKDHW